jgi:hypothetical protein
LAGDSNLERPLTNAGAQSLAAADRDVSPDVRGESLDPSV